MDIKLGRVQAPPPNPPQGGGAPNKSQPPRTKSNLKKKSRKKKNALTQDRTGRFTAILDFVMNGRSETICVGKTPLPKKKKERKEINMMNSCHLSGTSINIRSERRKPSQLLTELRFQGMSCMRMLTPQIELTENHLH